MSSSELTQRRSARQWLDDPAFFAAVQGDVRAALLRALDNITGDDVLRTFNHSHPERASVNAPILAHEAKAAMALAMLRLIKHAVAEEGWRL